MDSLLRRRMLMYQVGSNTPVPTPNQFYYRTTNGNAITIYQAWYYSGSSHYYDSSIGYWVFEWYKPIDKWNYIMGKDSDRITEVIYPNTEYNLAITSVNSATNTIILQEQWLGGIFMHQSNLTDVYCNTTIAEFERMSVRKDWRYGSAVFTIHCTDSDVLSTNFPR